MIEISAGNGGGLAMQCCKIKAIASQPISTSKIAPKKILLSHFVNLGFDTTIKSFRPPAVR